MFKSIPAESFDEREKKVLNLWKDKDFLKNL